MSSYILGTKPQHWAISVMRVRARETISSDPTTLASQVSVKCWKSTLAPVFSMTFLSVASRPITFLSKTSLPNTMMSVCVYISGINTICSHIHKQNCQRMKQSVTISLLPAPPQRMKQSVTFSLLPAPRLLFLSLLNIFLGGACGGEDFLDWSLN